MPGLAHYKNQFKWQEARVREVVSSNHSTANKMVNFPSFIWYNLL